MKKTKNFLDWNNRILASSMKKLNWNIVLIIILDAVFYVISAYLFVLWDKKRKALSPNMPEPTQLIALGYEKAQQALAQTKSYLFFIIFSLLLLLLIIIFLATIIKGIIWAKTLNKKLNLKLISKFLGLNLLWMSFWMLLIFLNSMFVEISRAPVFMIIILVLAFYFTNTLYALFFEKQKLSVIVEAVKLNVSKIHLFLVPYALIIAVLMIVAKLTNLMTFKYSFAASSFIMLVYFALVRYYASTLALEVEKLK